jgi:hypothetical protein
MRVEEPDGNAPDTELGDNEPDDTEPDREGETEDDED